MRLFFIVTTIMLIDGKVYIRDPWPLEGIGKGTGGVEAIVDLKAFSEFWLRARAVKFIVKK